MTHLSDLSYLQRVVSVGWLYVWFLIYVFKWDRFAALKWYRLRRFELRSVVTIMTLIGLILQLVYDVGSARLKYREGYWVDPKSKEIVSKPAALWSVDDLLHVEPLYFALAFALAFESAIFILLMAFWSFITKRVTKTTFMSSLEFKINIVSSFIVFVAFPTVQYITRDSHALREAVPQLMFSTLCIGIGCMGIRNQLKLATLLREALETMNETTAEVGFKLEYFKDMNLLLTISFFGSGISLAIVSFDGLLATPVIASNKFASDVLVTNLNFFEFVIWVSLILTFYPRKTTSVSYPLQKINVSVAQPKTHDIRTLMLGKHSNEAQRQTPDATRCPSNDLERQTGAKREMAWMDESPAGMDPIIHHRPTTELSQDPLNSPLTNEGKGNALESRTIYYHDALKMALARSNSNNDTCLPNHSSDNSSDITRFEESVPAPPLAHTRSTGSGNRYLQSAQPKRSTSQRSQHPLIEAITNEYQQQQKQQQQLYAMQGHHHHRSLSNDYHAPSEYRPSSRYAHNNPLAMQSEASPQRSASGRRPPLPEPIQTYGLERSSGSLGRRTPLEEADSNVPRTLYSETSKGGYNPTSFYESLGYESQAHHSRPHTPRG
ncbi:hypothetical protein BG004_004022 [Podila humilis]|nr:hypothetical protein BG004_004022 [Podila humilis]